MKKFANRNKGAIFGYNLKQTQNEKLQRNDNYRTSKSNLYL